MSYNLTRATLSENPFTKSQRYLRLPVPPPKIKTPSNAHAHEVETPATKNATHAIRYPPFISLPKHPSSVSYLAAQGP
jgi:hypothetical protein